MDLDNQSCSPSQPAVLHGKNFHIGHYVQTFQPHFFIPAMLIDTINLEN